MSELKRFEVTDRPLSLDDVAARVSRPDCGAIVTFDGVVRETVTADGERGTDFLEYEAYVEMAEQMLAAIGDEIQALAQGQGREHFAPGRALRDRRTERGHRGGYAPPRRRLLRGVQLRYRTAQGGGPHLETGKLGGRPSLGGRPAPTRTGPDSAGVWAGNSRAHRFRASARGSARKWARARTKRHIALRLAAKRP
ncbi:MAG: molybdenum cofactor biosynthesis protein MoaE [Caldilineaceae bacterium]